MKTHKIAQKVERVVRGRKTIVAGRTLRDLGRHPDLKQAELVMPSVALQHHLHPDQVGIFHGPNLVL